MEQFNETCIGTADRAIGRTATRNAATLTVRASFVLLLAEHCEQNGLSIKSLFEGVDLDARMIDRAEARVPFVYFMRLCERASRFLRDPFLGLHVGQSMRPGHFGPFGLALLCCGTVRQHLERAMAYSSTVSDVYSVELAQRGNEIVRTWHSRLPGTAPVGRFYDEMRMAAGCTLARLCLGRADLTLNWVSFRHERPRDVRDYESFFHCPVRFGGEATAAAFDMALLDEDLSAGNPDALALLDGLCEHELHKLRVSESPWLSACRAAIARSFRNGEISLELVASQIGLAPRTLRHRIERQGENFRSLVASIRFELARSYLANPDLSLVDIALLLGFSDQSTFQRSFKRCVGSTPGEYRRSRLRDEIRLEA